ncbi:hypothetical protein C8R44DRAFT_546434, partial [Mycena epipterygia]
VLWITNALSPQEIRDRIMKPDSKFRKCLIAYLEDCHKVEYFHGSRDVVIDARKVQPLPDDANSNEKLEVLPGYSPPTQTFAKPPPKACTAAKCPDDRQHRKRTADWWDAYKLEVEDILLRHKLRRCLTMLGVCRARFPRDVFNTPEISADRHVNMQHHEPMMNTVNSILTYLSRCNSDVTSLLSGTAVKAVVSYVSDYVSKLSFKSYQLFVSVYDVFEK